MNLVLVSVTQTRENFLRISKELEQLKKELDEIQKTYSEKFQEEVAEIQAEESLQPKNSEPDVITSTDVDIQNLVKKIAQKCHPDKTSNAELNSLLVDALEAKDSNPAKVIEIYEMLFSTKVAVSEDIYIKKLRELEQLKSSQMYRVLMAHKQKEKIKAKMIFLELLHNKLTRLRNRKK